MSYKHCSGQAAFRNISQKISHNLIPSSSNTELQVRKRSIITQTELVDIVTRGDVSEVQQFFFAHPQYGATIDRPSQLAALIPAIQKNFPNILKLLLMNKFKIGSSLFMAVREGSKDCVEIIIMNLKGGDIGPETIISEMFINPLMLAIRLEHCDIIKLLLDKGHRIRKRNRLASEYKKNEEDDECIFEPSLRRIHTYRALANPLYLAYTYLLDEKPDHPLLQIFSLNKELLQNGESDIEFKTEYQYLSKRLGTFAVELLEECHKVKEIKVLTDVTDNLQTNLGSDKKYVEVRSDKSGRDLSFLNLAIRRNNVQLVVHPYSQLRLNEVLYRGIYTLFPCEPLWRQRSFLSRIVYSIRHMLLLPFLTLMYLLFPKSKIAKSMTSPMIKFHSHTGAFGMFVVLLMLSSFQDRFSDNIVKPTAIDYVILVWVLGLGLQEAKEFYQQGFHRFINQWWNIISTVMLLLFSISYILRFAAYVIYMKKTGASADSVVLGLASAVWFQMMLFSNATFSFAMVLSFVHLSSAFQVSNIFGPMQLSLYKILVDVLKFLVFFFTLFMAFGFSLRRLHSQYISTQNHLYEVILSGKYNSTKIPDTDHPFSSVYYTLHSLYWSVFGMSNLKTFATNDDDYQITNISGELLFGLFQILMVIIAMNMLIAMMSKSYENVAGESDSQWKMSRTQMWMNWVDKGNSIPAPLNIFKIAIAIFCSTCLIFNLAKKKCCSNAQSASEGLETIGLQRKDDQSSISIDDERRETIREIIKRYLSNHNSSSKKSDDRETTDKSQHTIKKHENIMQDIKKTEEYLTQTHEQMRKEVMLAAKKGLHESRSKQMDDIQEEKYVIS